MEIPPDLLANAAQVTPTRHKNIEKIRKKRKPPKVPWKKPKDMPKRPLSAYNLFFQHEREQLVRSTKSKGSPVGRKGAPDHPRSSPKPSGIGFANLAKTIAAKWKTIDPTSRSKFEAEAAEEKARYNKEMVVWRKKKKDEAEAVESIPEVARSSERDSNQLEETSPVTTQRRNMSATWPPSQVQHITPSLGRRSSEPPFYHLEELRRQLEPLPLSPVTSRDHRFVPMSPFQSRLALLSPPQCRDNRFGHLGDNEHWLDAFGASNTIRSVPEFHEDTLQIRSVLGERSMSDSLVNLHSPGSFDQDMRTSDDILSGSIVPGDHKRSSTSIPSTLRALGTSLDDDTVDFLTNLKFDSI